MRINRFIAALCIAVIGWTWSALASGPNFNDTTSKPLTGNSSGNVGIGTTTPQGAFVVTNGNVGIGTWTAANASLETTGLRLIGNGAAAGSVLVSSSTGIGTWMSASTLATSGGGAPGGASSQLQYNNGGSFDGIVNSNVTASGNVGLGTTLSMNKLDVSGGVGIGTGYAGYRTAPTDGLIVQGNVGIGTRIPYQTSSLAKLSIANSGDASALELYTPSISGQGAFNIVAPLSTAITDGKAFSFIVPGENFARGMFYTDGSYGVGPGSAARDLYISRRATSTLMISSDRTTTGTAHLTVTGNVGIGTIAPSNQLAVAGGVGIGTVSYSPFTANAAPSGGMIVQGNVGIGTFSPVNQLDVSGIPSAVSGAQIGATDTTAMTTEVGGGIRFSGFYNATAQATFGSVRGYKMNSTSDNYAGGLRFLTRVDGSGSVSERMRIDSAGNVGIGTTTTQGGLVVTNGNVGIGTWTAANTSLETTGLRLIGNGAAAGRVLVSSSTGIGTWMSASTLPPAAGAWSTGTGTVYTTTGSDNVGIGTTTPQGGLVVTNGNVGIGTFAPTQALDINGNIATSGSGDSYFLGNVGMGTSAPGKALDVSGTMRATDITVGSTGFVVDSSGNVTAVASTTTTGGYTQSGTSANTFTGTSTFSNATKSAIFTGGNVGVGTTTPQAKLAVIGGNVGIGTWTAVNASLETTGIRLIGNGAAAGSVLVSSSTGIGTWMAASTLATSGSTPSGWSTGTGTVYNTTGSDKVGIGTTTPQGGFVVTNGNVGIGTWDTATGALIVRGSTTSGSLVAIGSATGINHGVSVDLYVQNATTDGTAAAFETTSGNISQRPLELIGSSYSLLDVVLHNNNGSVGSSAGIGFNPTVAAYAGGAYSAYSTIKAVNMSGGAPYYQDLTFENNGSDGMLERMRITSTGNVGIGTVVPGSGLSIAGGVGIGTGKNSSFVSAAAPSGGMIVQGNVGIGTTTPQGGLVITNGNVGIGTWATGGGNLIVKGGGNVGINTVYPGSLLDINGGGLRIVGSGPNVYTITPNSGTVASFFLTGGTGYLYETKMGVSTNTDFLLYQNNTEKLWFRNDGNIAIAHLGGNVGIGTTTPYSKFAVMGGNVGIGTFIASTLFEVGRQKFNVTAQGNVGVGTITPQGGLVITSGNVGIGTWTAANASLETTGLRLIGNGAAAGSVLVSGSTGIGTWMAASTLATTGGGGSPGGSSSQLQYNNGGSFDGVPNSGVDSNGNIGIGTSSTQAKLVVTGGSVGVGTWSPGSTLSVDGSLAIGSGFSWRAAPSNGMIVAGQTCIGCAVVGAATLSVNRDTNANGNDNLILDNSEFAAGKTSTILFNTGGSSRARIYGGLDGSSAAMMSFEVASSEAVRLNSNGNMGLGTMDPQGKLIVVGGNVGIGTWTAGYANLVVRGNVGIGTTNATTADLNVYGSVGIGTAASFNNLKVGNLIATNSEFDNGSQSGAYPLDWNKGNKQKITMAGSFTITMTAPTSGVTNLLLKVVQDGTGSRTPTLAAASGGVKWAGGAAPSWSTAINAVDIVTCYWDGSNYYCVGSLNFQ